MCEGLLMRQICKLFEKQDLKQPPSIMHQVYCYTKFYPECIFFSFSFFGAMRAVINIFPAILDSGLQGPVSPAEPNPKFCWYISFLLRRCHSYSGSHTWLDFLVCPSTFPYVFPTCNFAFTCHTCI